MAVDTYNEAESKTEVTDSTEAVENSEKKAKKKNGDKKKSRFFKPVLLIIAICFCFFAVADIITQQAEIQQLKEETETISKKIDETKQLSDEYTEMLNAEEAEFMEKVAVEQLGYAYPNERRFYIINGSSD